MVQTNADGTMSLIQVDPANPVITLPDGTTAHVQGVAHLETANGDPIAVQQITGDAAVACQLNANGEITTSEASQILIAGEDGQGMLKSNP